MKITKKILKEINGIKKGMNKRAITTEQKKEVIEALFKAWNAGNNSFLRLGQFFMCLGVNDLFYIEDEDLVKAFEKFTVLDVKREDKVKPLSLKSSVEKVGKKVTQILHFSGGNKRTIEHILTDTIKQGEFTKMFTEDKRMILVNTPNVDLIEVFSED